MDERVPAVLVTGGSRGIGAAIATRAAEKGFDVCFSYLRNAEAAERVAETIERSGRRGLAVQSDVSKESDVLSLFQTAIDSFGSIAGLVNNAGILDLQCRLEDVSFERVQRIYQTNVFGSILCAREAVKHMSTRHGGKGGSIVNISSITSRTGGPGEYVDYASSKGAIDSLTIGLAKEVATEGIRVNAVRPGSTHTDIHAAGGEPNRIERIKGRIPMNRGGTPQEIAAAAVWLLSDDAAYTTGALLDVAGGI